MSATDPRDPQRFSFAFDGAYRLPARLLGINEGSAFVTVADGLVEARFGPWTVRTPVANISGAKVTGPYAVPLTIGPPHLSLKDRGLTFATNPRRGACLEFREPVRGIDPLGLVRHPGLTVTVDDPAALVAALEGEGAGPAPEEERLEQEAVDNLHTMTASQLRELAAERGITHASSAKKADLVELLEADLGDEIVEELVPDA